MFVVVSLLQYQKKTTNTLNGDLINSHWHSVLINATLAAFSFALLSSYNNLKDCQCLSQSASRSVWASCHNSGEFPHVCHLLLLPSIKNNEINWKKKTQKQMKNTVLVSSFPVWNIPDLPPVSDHVLLHMCHLCVRPSYPIVPPVSHCRMCFNGLCLHCFMPETSSRLFLWIISLGVVQRSRGSVLMFLIDRHFFVCVFISTLFSVPSPVFTPTLPLFTSIGVIFSLSPAVTLLPPEEHVYTSFIR